MNEIKINQLECERSQHGPLNMYDNDINALTLSQSESFIAVDLMGARALQSDMHSLTDISRNSTVESV